MSSETTWKNKHNDIRFIVTFLAMEEKNFGWQITHRMLDICGTNRPANATV